MMVKTYPNERIDHVLGYYLADHRGLPLIEMLRELEYMVGVIRPVVLAEAMKIGKRGGVNDEKEEA